MATVRDEITKWLINERIILSTKSVKNLTYSKLLKLYLKKIHGGYYKNV